MKNGKKPTDEAIAKYISDIKLFRKYMSLDATDDDTEMYNEISHLNAKTLAKLQITLDTDLAICRVATESKLK